MEVRHEPHCVGQWFSHGSVWKGEFSGPHDGQEAQQAFGQEGPGKPVHTGQVDPVILRGVRPGQHSV